VTCYGVKFTFPFTFDYDYHTFGSVSEGKIHMWYVKQFNKDLTIQKDKKKNITGCEPEELLAILLQNETRVIAVQET
jgi:hypothetical protein